MESNIQSRLIKALKKAGWIINKPNGNSVDGWPDVQAYKGGTCLFFECKRPGQKPTKLQQYRMDELTKEGFDCYVWDGSGDLNEIIKLE